MTNVPISTAPHLAFSGLQLSNDSTSPNTVLNVSTGYAYDSTNTVQLKLSTASTIDATINGEGGLDKGTFAASTWYAVCLQGSSLNLVKTTVIMTLASNTVPQLSDGCDVFRVIGYWYSNSSTHFTKGYSFGNGATRKFYYDTSVSVLTAGAATSLTNINLITAVPALSAVSVNFSVDFTPATAGNKVGVATAGSSATVIPHVTGAVSAVVSSGFINQLAQLISGNPTVRYIVSNGSDAATIYVNSFEYSL